MFKKYFKGPLLMITETNFMQNINSGSTILYDEFYMMNDLCYLFETGSRLNDLILTTCVYQ